MASKDGGDRLGLQSLPRRQKTELRPQWWKQKFFDQGYVVKGDLVEKSTKSSGLI